MSTSEPLKTPSTDRITTIPGDKHVGGLFDLSEESHSEKLLDAIEMLGEEKAAGLRPVGHSEVSPGMRYLHCSRTIHQLVTDRNRAVGIFLAVASLLVTASSAILHAKPDGDLIIPLLQIQRWCFPLTFGCLTVLAIFVALLLIRTRVGLIYEVAKMNVLLGLPLGRVSRISPLSIFFLMQVMISMAGGFCAALFSMFMIRLADPDAGVIAAAILIGIVVTGLLLAIYVAAVCYITSDERLAGVDEAAKKPAEVPATAK
jgi:hypothetical protein